MTTNNMLLAQQFLETHSLSELKFRHGINYRRFDNKMSLNYDQIESKESDPLAKQCRGIILAFDNSYINLPDKDFENIVIGPTKIIARPFDRFFNYGQEAAVNIKFDKEQNIKWFSKLDGSFIIFNWDPFKSKWCVATCGIPEANLPIDGFKEYTFTTLFYKAIQETTGASYEDWLDAHISILDKDVTYLFELTSPYNRIVVKYNDCKVHLLGARNIKTGLELHPESIAPNINIPVCPSFQINNLNDMLKYVADMNPLENEGIVVCTQDFRRVKVKNPSYVAYNRIRDQVANSPRALLQIILDEKLDDFMQLLPQNYLDKAIVYQEKLRELLKSFIIQYNKCLSEVNKLGVMSDKVKQKQFALEVQKNKYWLAPMMAIYNGKHKNIKEFFDSHKIHNGEYKTSFLNTLLEKFENEQ